MNKKIKSLAVDFDGTLFAATCYPDTGKKYWIHKLIIWYIKRKQSQGTILILNTLRDKDNALDSGYAYDKAVYLCNEWGIYFDIVNDNIKEETEKYGYARKIKADRYIDDRNIGLIGWILRLYNKKEK